VSVGARLVRHRVAVLAGLLATAAAIGSFAPGIEAHFEPEELVAPDERARDAHEAMRRAFGEEEQALVIVIEAPDVLELETLRWMHRTALALGRDPSVRRVESPTTTPLPHEAPPAPATDATLDELDDLDEDDAAPSPVDSPALRALGTIAAADPQRWPMGMLSIAERGQALVVRPVAPASGPTAETASRLGELLEASPLLRRRLVAPDHSVAVIAAVLADPDDRGAADRLVRRAERLAAGPPAGVRASLSGVPAIRLTMIEALHRDQLLLILLAAIASVTVLVLGTRSVAGVVLPMGTVGITVALTVGGMALAGEPLNLLTNMIPPLLVTIGLAEAVHMVLRWEEEVRAGADRTQAAVRTLETMWLACFVTTFTTAAGFGALMLQETAILRKFGLIAALASMLAYVVTVLFVPALLPSFRPSRAQASEASGGALERAVTRMAAATSARWRVTLGVSTLLLAGSLWMARDVVVDSTLMDQFARDSDVARTTGVLEAGLDGVRSVDIGLRAPEGTFATPEGIARLDELAGWLRAQPGVLRVTSGADWLAEVRALLVGDPELRDARWRGREELAGYRALLAATASAERGDPLARFLSRDGAAARLEVRLADRGASRILAMLGAFETRARERFEVTFSGEAYDASRGLDRIVSSLGSLGAAVALIFAVMTLLFRSLRLGLLSVPPNALPLAMTLAYMTLRGIPLNAATVIVFTVTLGLAVDGATHVIARFREEALPGRDAREIVLRTVASSGRGVIVASATLLLGYGALLFSAFEPVRLFGELSFVAIFGSLLAQLVLLPALLATFALPRARAADAHESAAPLEEPAGEPSASRTARR
jgi:hypothetical protein